MKRAKTPDDIKQANATMVNENDDQPGRCATSDVG